MGREPARLKGILSQVLAGLGQEEKFHGWRMVELWPDVVGADIARISRAVRFVDGALIVIVEKDAWRQELEMQRELILNKIRSLPGGYAVKKIILRAGSFQEIDNEQDG